ncbi:MAG: hypothetical protein CVV52_02185 [Spirochaetae bacterium HGW-Spirochaetae-8]|nr:MAG: hypothetical protein CVV52_02185 [Spirochaetae bacterium HGW-Spirochaetae-8]
MHFLKIAKRYGFDKGCGWQYRSASAIVTSMKNLIKLVLLASFAVVVFIPNKVLANGLYWLLFVFMFGLLFLYYHISYWVGLKQVQSVMNETVLFSVFCGKVPPIAAEDLVRGRLVVTASKIVLFQKNSDRRRSPDPCLPVWSVEIGDITGFGLGKVVALRKGLILYLKDEGEARFTVLSMSRKKEALTSALGWSDSSGGQR